MTWAMIFATVWTLDLLLIGLIGGYFLAKRLVGVQAMVELTTYRGQPNIHVLNMHIQAPGRIPVRA
jgi:hypothetical protein